MKRSLLVLVLAVSFSNVALAKAKVTKKKISGREAIAQFTGNILDPRNSPFEADDCSIEVTERGHNLEIKSTQKDQLKSTIEFSEDKQYKLITTDMGDSEQVEIETLDGRQSVTMLPADDAFNEVTTVKDGVKVDCEQDM